MTSLLPSSLRHLSLGLLLTVALCLSGETARAQSGLKPTIQRIDTTQITREQPLREANKLPYWVSRADCLADDVITFRIQVTTPNTDNFEVWAGPNDCSQTVQRQGDQASCWLVYSSGLTRSPADVPIHARDLAAQNTPVDGATGVAGTESDCNTQKHLTIGLYFMYINDSGQISSNVIQFSGTGVDLEGPPTPEITDVLPSDTRLIVNWNTTNATEFAGYRIYCEKVASTATSGSGLTLLDGAVVDAAALPDGSSTGANPLDAAALPIGDGGSSLDASNQTGDAGGSTSNGCGGTQLIEGQLPSSKLLCGEESAYTATTGYAKKLKNGQAYAIGITAVDNLGNESVLSNVECNSPREVYTFFEDYRQAGGGGGGGFCALARPNPRSPHDWSWLGLLALGACLKLRRINN